MYWILGTAGPGVRTLTNIAARLGSVRQRTEGDYSAGEDACAIVHGREDPTVIPTPIPHDNSTRRVEQDARAPTADESRLMAELAIIRGGRHYFYDGYSYDRPSEAIAYAQLVVRGQSHRPGPSSAAQLEASAATHQE